MIPVPSLAAGIFLGLLAVALPAAAQPAPSFLATCGELRASLDKLGHVEELTTIAVRGTLTLAEMQGPLAYMAVCSAPYPQVLCITYGLSGRKVGEEVILTGALSRVGPDHVMLDPCLNSPPDTP